MSWRKNVFSNIMWSAYTLLTVVGLVELSGAAVRIFRGPSYMGPVLAIIVAVLASVIVFLFHKFTTGLVEVGQRNSGRLVLVEYALMAFFLIMGLMLRINGMSGAGSGGEYYEAAMVAAGKSVPQVVHGAVYFHLRLLHLVFLVAGNKVSAGIWLQIILQLLAGALSYFGVKKLVGVIPAQLTLLFFMFAEPMVQSSVVLSPEPLYLLLLAVGIFILAMCRTKVDLIYLFLPVGLWTGLMIYLDISGFFLLFLAAALILADWNQDTSLKERGAAFGLCVAGTMGGFLVSVVLDSLLSGKSFIRIMNAWQALYGYGPSGFSTSNLADGLYWEGPLLLLMCFGVFSYWRNRENQNISMWMLILGLVALTRYDGMLTKEISPSMYIILCLSVLAGVGIRASFNESDIAVAKFMTQESNNSAEVIGDEYEEDEDIAPIKLPKYLLEPESGEIKIPKYLQEEVEAAKPKPKPEPAPAPVVPEAEEPAPALTESTDRYVVSKPEEIYVEPVQEQTETQEVVASKEPQSSMNVSMEEVLWEEEVFEAERPKETASPVEAAPVETAAPIAAVTPVAAVKSNEELWPSAESVSSSPQYIENPLPLPKPHQKKVMEYDVVSKFDDDYDYPVADDDDFDIK